MVTDISEIDCGIISRASEAGMTKRTDDDQLRFAASGNRVLITSNIADFARLHGQWLQEGLGITASSSSTSRSGGRANWHGELFDCWLTRRARTCGIGSSFSAMFKS